MVFCKFEEGWDYLQFPTSLIILTILCFFSISGISEHVLPQKCADIFVLRPVLVWIPVQMLHPMWYGVKRFFILGLELGRMPTQCAGMGCLWVQLYCNFLYNYKNEVIKIKAIKKKGKETRLKLSRTKRRIPLKIRAKELKERTDRSVLWRWAKKIFGKKRKKKSFLSI